MLYFKIVLTYSLFLINYMGTVLFSEPVPFSPYIDFSLDAPWKHDSKIKSYHLAFINDSGNCQPAWSGKAEYSVQNQWGKTLINRLSAQGVKIIISFGGAVGRDLSDHCITEQLVTEYTKIIEIYHPSGLDFDIENGSANVSRIVQALKILEKNYPQLKLSFTLPVMPEGLTAEGKRVVSTAKEMGLAFNVNIMTMSYGPSYNGNMSAYAIEAANNLKQYLAELYPTKSSDALWKLIEITPLIGLNDFDSERFTLTDAEHLQYFAKKYQIGGLSMWSMHRDKPCSDKKISPLCSGLNLQTHDYEFIEHFQLFKLINF